MKKFSRVHARAHAHVRVITRTPIKVPVTLLLVTGKDGSVKGRNIVIAKMTRHSVGDPLPYLKHVACSI